MCFYQEQTGRQMKKNGQILLKEQEEEEKIISGFCILYLT